MLIRLKITRISPTNLKAPRLGSLARLKQADSLLNNASRNMFTDRETANKELTAAEKALDRLGNSSSIDDAVRDRIAIDQARLAEIRCDGTDASVQTSVDAWQKRDRSK